MRSGYRGNGLVRLGGHFRPHYAPRDEGKTTVESAELDFSRFGMQSRAFCDFGAALLEHRGGVKAAGS